MNNPLRQEYEQHYASRIPAFLDEVGELDPTGIPDPHLPLWGNRYETAAPRIAFIGQDTAYWGDMAEFRETAKQNLQTAIFGHEDVFRDLPFTRWTNNFGTTFWDTVMQFLAVFHDIPDWKQLKRRQRDDILQTFVWAQTNAVELWGSTPSKEGANFEAWQRIKTASERHLDSFSSLLDMFRPQLAIVMNWSVRDDYWNLPLQWETLGHHARYAFDTAHTTHIFHTAHPNGMRDDRTEIFEMISNKWQTVSRAADSTYNKNTN
jgi:hypothetical protein